MGKLIKTDIKANKNDLPIDFNQLIDSSISKPARYMGLEQGVEYHNWDKAKVRWALTYPEIYEIGASNLGHIILYSILNKVPGQICDRAYLPDKDLALRLREQSLPLFGVESRRPLISFDLVGFSLSYELGATNILEMLDLSGIKLNARERQNIPLNEPHSTPLIFAGGPTATSNPEPYASFFDFFTLGDGEEVLPEIGLIIAQGKEKNLSRFSLLKEISEIPGVYVPSFYSPSKKSPKIEPIQPYVPHRVLRRVSSPMPSYGMGLVPYVETVHDRLTIEIRRGCTKGCRFCQPGMLTRPARDLKPKEVIHAVEAGMKQTGYSDFSLLSLSCSDYLSLPSVGIELRNRLSKENISLQLPSQRIDRFDDNIAHILGGNRKSGLTFAPEAGTQRLRDIINKGLSDEDLLKGIRTAMKNNYRKIKLYFMIGLPGERDEDVIGIANTCKNLQSNCRDLGYLNFNITISNFTPKPHTPFQWHSVSHIEFMRKQKILKEAFRQIKGIKVNYTDIRISSIEDFIGRGGRELSPVIEAAWRSGAGMDAWFESQDKVYGAWKTAIIDAGLEGKYRKLELGNWSTLEQLSKDDLIKFCNQPLPWDHIDSGITKQWLINDLQRALNLTTVPDCSFNECSSCGVCGSDLGHNVVIQPPPIPDPCTTSSPPQEKISRVLIKFSKTNPMHLISHLDLMRLLERCLRKSQLPVSYSGGFHSLPRIRVALALPLGVEALNEWLDIDFYEDVPAQTIKAELEKQLPKGIKLLSAINIPVKSSNLSQKIKGAIWSFDLIATESKYPSVSEWKKAINKLLQANELIWKDKDKKGRPRERDFHEALISLKINHIENLSSDISKPQRVRLQLHSEIDESGRSIKPIQVKNWLDKIFGLDLKLKSIKRDELQLKCC